MKLRMPPIEEKLEFIPSKSYIENLAKELQTPFKKVIFYYFKIMAEDQFLQIAKVLSSALEKGYQVELNLDAIYSKTNIDGGNFYYPLLGEGKKINEDAISKNLELFKNLKEKGAKINFFNEPNWINKQIPFAKRDHRKIVIIERELGSITYFGATNFSKEDQNDFMIKVLDHKLSEEIAKISSYENIKNQNEDIILPITENLTFLLDIGKNFHSKIQKNSYEMIMKARNEVIFVSQIPPELPLLMRFVAARINGANVQIVLPAFTNRDISGFPFILVFMMAWVISKVFKIKISHCAEEYSHAKILICDGAVLLGSHNLSSFGVACGTVEFSAYIKNEKFLNKVKSFVDFLIGNKLEEKTLSQRDFV